MQNKHSKPTCIFYGLSIGFLMSASLLMSDVALADGFASVPQTDMSIKKATTDATNQANIATNQAALAAEKAATAVSNAAANTATANAAAANAVDAANQAVQAASDMRAKIVRINQEQQQQRLKEEQLRLHPDEISKLTREVKIQKLKNQLQDLHQSAMLKALPLVHEKTQPVIATTPSSNVAEKSKKAAPKKTKHVDLYITIKSIHMDKKGKPFAILDVEGDTLNVRQGDKIEKGVRVQKITDRQVFIKEVGKVRQIGFKKVVTTSATNRTSSTSDSTLLNGGIM